MNNILSLSISVASIFSLLIFSSCSKDYNKMNWPEVSATSNISESRGVAAAQKECFIELSNLEQIKKEITQMEKAFKVGTELPGVFNFAEFNNAESAFLYIGEDLINLSEEAKKCDTLVCILNTSYGKTGESANSGEEGFRIYHWYLKMGSIISTSDKIPGYTFETSYALKDYLFTNDELKAFNMESKVLSTKYLDMLMKSIHRFPNGTRPGTNVAGLFSPGSASYRTSAISTVATNGSTYSKPNS